MQLSELVTAVEGIIQDAAFTEADIISYLNEAQNEVAGGVQSALGDWITPPLPELFTIGTVDTVTDAAYVSMPANFQRQLQFVASPDGYEIDIEDSFISFSETYPLLDYSGSVTSCVEFGNNFYYQGIPTEVTTLTIHYYRLPTDMVDDEDTPDGIPAHLHRGLLVNHACWKIFELIEDGLEGDTPNTNKYMERFYRAAKTLELFVPYEARGMNTKKDY